MDSSSNVTFALSWKGPYKSEGWDLSVVDIHLPKCNDEISGNIKKKAPSDKEQQLEITRRNPLLLGSQKGMTFECSLATAKVMTISVRMFQDYENPWLKTQNGDGSYSNEIRSRMENSHVKMNPFPNLENGQIYQIKIVHQDNILSATIVKNSGHAIAVLAPEKPISTPPQEIDEIEEQLAVSLRELAILDNKLKRGWDLELIRAQGALEQQVLASYSKLVKMGVPENQLPPLPQMLQKAYDMSKSFARLPSAASVLKEMEQEATQPKKVEIAPTIESSSSESLEEDSPIPLAPPAQENCIIS